MKELNRLFDNNRAWTDLVHAEDPGFFPRLSQQQSPEYLWIGCSDSRVPANEIVGLLPGELFVHRNVANLVVHTDLNCLSVMQYAVDILKVKHVIVCGHYGCGGVWAALQNARLGLIDNWLRHLQDVRLKHEDYLAAIPDEDVRCDRLCELNVIEQVANICHTTVAQDAWARGQYLAVHSWIYGLNDGLLRDLGMCVTNPDEFPGAYREGIEATKKRNMPSLHTHAAIDEAFACQHR
jgi:carbonic anhydrase